MTVVNSGQDRPITDLMTGPVRVIVFEGTTKEGALSWVKDNVDGDVKSVDELGDIAGTVVVSVDIA